LAFKSAEEVLSCETFEMPTGKIRNVQRPGFSEGVAMEDDPQFVCAAYDKDDQGDTGNVMTECRVCHRIHFKDCVDESNRCIECSKSEGEKH
jgi:hypothetical protein